MTMITITITPLNHDRDHDHDLNHDHELDHDNEHCRDHDHGRDHVFVYNVIRMRFINKYKRL